MHHHDGRQRQLEEPHRLADAAPAFVHIGRGLEQIGLAAAQRAFADHAVKPRPPWAERIACLDRVDRDEAGIVAVARILRAGIAEPGDEEWRVRHGSGLASLAPHHDETWCYLPSP